MLLQRISAVMLYYIYVCTTLNPKPLTLNPIVSMFVCMVVPLPLAARRELFDTELPASAKNPTPVNKPPNPKRHPLGFRV